jgi:hypothetical protein
MVFSMLQLLNYINLMSVQFNFTQPRLVRIQYLLVLKG